MKNLRAWLPDADAIRANRWLRWLGPALHHPRLWHLNRRGLALGMALGLFFGLLIPLAQIPLSAAAAVVLRAHLPTAVASTLVTNPLTFGPVYYAAWMLGSALLGEPAGTPPPLPGAETVALAGDAAVGAWQRAVDFVLGVGKPLMLGLAVLATGVGIGTYFIVLAAWRVTVLWKRRQRRR